MEADSEADLNIMDKHQFKAYVHRTSDKSTLKTSKIKLRTLQHKLDVKGEFETVILSETCGNPPHLLLYLEEYSHLY